MAVLKTKVARTLVAAAAFIAFAFLPFALSVAPAPAAAADGGGSMLVSAIGGSLEVSGLMAAEGDDGLAAVQSAANEAKAYIEAQGFKAPAFKDVLEWKLSGARCYSVADGVYLVNRNGATYRCVNGSVSGLASDGIPASYDTLAAAQAAIDSSADKPSSFVTRGIAVAGDRGHGYYVRRSDAGDSTAADAYVLTSAEGAVNVFQLGYVAGGSVSPAIEAFQQSGFHTLVFPEGRYLVTTSIWQRYDDKAFYGLGAELYTDGSFTNANGSITQGVLLSVRGNVVWGERQPDLGNERYDAYYTTSHQEYNGLAFTKSAELTSPGWSNMVRVRNANDITFSHCSFVDAGKNALCIDLYGNYDGVVLEDVTCVGNGDVQIRDLCDSVERLSGLYDEGATSKGWIYKGTTGGGRNVTVRDCTLAMGNSVEEGLPIFAGNQQGLKDKNGNEYPILSHCLVENVTIENSSFTMEEPTQESIERRGTSRIVAFTCGYEDSPVRNVVIRGNTFDVFANYCFTQFGYVDGVEISGNTVRMWGDEPGGKWGDKWADVFERDSFSRAGPTTNVSVHDNVFTLESGRTLTRLIDPRLGAGALSFTDNEVSVEGETVQLLDSTATCTGNTFHLHDVKSLYSDVREVRGNVYEIDKLGNLYEADGADAARDVVIQDEEADIDVISGNLMAFNNRPRYNGHSIVLRDCDFRIGAASAQYHYIAYDPSGISDQVVVSFEACTMPGFETRPYNTIPRNDDGKVILMISGAANTAKLSVAAVETQSGDADYADVASKVSLSASDSVKTKDVGYLSGRFIGAFSLSSEQSFGYAEVSLGIAAPSAEEGDVLALFRKEGDEWKSFGYRQVHDGAIAFELSSNSDLGEFALVNKMPDFETNPTDLSTLSGSSGDAKLMAAVKAGGFYAVSEDAGAVIVPRHYLNSEGKYASQLDFRNLNLLCDDMTENNGFTFASGGGNDFYFEGCTFDRLDFAFRTSGHYAFVNCTFTRYPFSAIAAQATGAHVYLFGCTFSDNAPDKDRWNENRSGDRYNNYSAVRLRGDSTSLHARGCLFRNLQTDTSIHVQKVGDADFENVVFCFEGNEMHNCGGHNIAMDNVVHGRIDGNTFTEVGGTRGMNGYKSTIDPTLGEPGDKPGAGVGGNAVFARGRNPQMRVRGNTCVNLMENAIEGMYYCVTGNHVDTTGYRYNDTTGDCYNGGYKTVSTEGIAAPGTWYVTDNVVLNVHGRGIGVSHWRNHPIVVENNVVTRQANGHPGDDTSEGIKIRTDENSWKNVTVRNNQLSGFLNNYRIIHSNDPDKLRTCENVVIEDVNSGKLMGEVMSHVRGVKLTTNRDVPLDFVNGVASAWSGNNLSELSDQVEGDGTKFVRMKASGEVDSAGAARGRVSQTFELPDKTCIVCLELKVRSTSPKVNAFVTSGYYDEGGAFKPYPSGDGGSYSQYKVPLNNIDPGEFATVYACLKARGETQIGLFVSEADQQIDIASVCGWYAQDAPIEYAIAYNLNGGAVPAGKSNPSAYTALDSFELANPVRTGYQFAGWTGTGLGGPTTSVAVAAGSTGDRSYEATWRELPDMLGLAAVTASVANGAASLLGFIDSVPATLVIDTMTDNPSGTVVPVKAIGAHAVAGAGQLKSLAVGNNVGKIGKFAFKGCTGLKSARLGKNVKTVGAGAFSGAKKLKVLKVASTKLTKASCKKMLSGSKVRTVKLVGMSKKQKAKALKKYRKWFPKKVAGKKLVVK